MAASETRRAYQERVAWLLAEIDRRRQRLLVLQAYGVKAAGMRDLKAELQAVRDELAVVITAGSSRVRALSVA
jgi:hypothetical protein